MAKKESKAIKNPKEAPASDEISDVVRSVEIWPGLSGEALVNARKEARRTIGYVEAGSFKTKDGSRTLITRYEYAPGNLPKSAMANVGDAATGPSTQAVIEHYTGVPQSELPAVRAMIRADGGTVLAEYPDGLGTYTVVAQYA